MEWSVFISVLFNTSTNILEMNVHIMPNQDVRGKQCYDKTWLEMLELERHLSIELALGWAETEQ